MEYSTEQEFLVTEYHEENFSDEPDREVEGAHEEQEAFVAENNSDNVSEHNAVEDNLQDQTEDLNAGTAAETGGERWPGWPGENVFRILMPANKVGSLIGRKGEIVKKLCEESKARIKILDGLPGASERVVIVSAKEEPYAPVSPAMDGLFRIHRRIIGLDGEASEQNSGATIITRILTAGSQSRSLIGKQGSIVKQIQEASKTVVRVREEVPPISLPEDRVVEIQGPAEGVHKALELIASELRKYLVDRGVIPLFEATTPMASAQPAQPWGYGHHGPSTTYSASDYAPGYSNPFIPFQPTRDSYQPASEYPAREKAPHHGISTYGREAPPSFGMLTKPHASQITQHMQIPISYADAVIGASGANISYVRRTSGATVTIQESIGVPGEMTVEIGGSNIQVQTAQQLIQNFMAEAAPQSLNVPSSRDYTHNSYQSYGSTYGSQSNNDGPPYNGGYGGSAYARRNYGY